MSGFRQTLLQGVRVLDASRVLAGPFCGQLLGDLGAEVIKVERPGAGDETRDWGPPFVGDLSAYYLSCNRNKQAVALDLGRPEGRELFHALARRSDVVLENFRPDSAAKLGLAPAELLALNPRLIVCSVSGFGRTGPLSDLPGYDFAIQGLSGLMSITGPPGGPPCKVGVAVTDVLTGLHAAVAVLACLYARERSGHGYHVDLALLDCALAAQVNVAQAFLATGAVPARQGNAHLQIVPYQTFRTADDWLILAVGNDGQFRRFCQAAGRPELADDERFATNSARVRHRDELIPQLEPLLAGRPAAEWHRLLEEHQVPFAPVWDYRRLFDQEQVRARGMRVTVRTPDGQEVDLLGSPFHVADAGRGDVLCPPRLGQHTGEVLARLLGLDGAALERLRASGVIG